MITKTFKEKLLAAFLIVAVTVTMIPASFALTTEQADAASTMQFTSHWDVSGGGDKAVRFKGVSGTASAGYFGFCAKAGYKHYSSKKSYTIKDVKSHDFGKLAYYYGYVKGWTSGEKGCKLSRAFNYVDNYDTDSSYAGKAYHFSASTLKNMRDNARDYCKSHPIPSNFHVYFVKPSDGSRKQTGVVWKMDPYGYLTGVKTSTDANSLAAGSGYTFEGIQYTVYNGSSAVGTLTCNASGKMNTLTLSPGTYTVKETKTNASYKLNDQTYTVKVNSSATASFTAKDDPKKATIKIRKNMQGSYDGSLSFKFTLTNIENPSIKYIVTTNDAGEAELEVVQGTYKCEEVLTAEEMDQFEDVTGAQTSVKLAPGDTYTFERNNKVVRQGTLSVSKIVGDNGPLDGFKFKVTGILYNQGEINADKILETADPQISEYDEEAYELGSWSVNSSDVSALNEAAKNANQSADMKSEIHKVKLTNKLTYKTGGARTPVEIVDALDPVPQPTDDVKKGTIDQGTMIKNGSNYYVAEEDVKYDFAFTEPVEADPTAEPPVEAKEAEFDRNGTIDNIKNLLSDNEKFNSVDTSDVNINVEVPIRLKDVEYVYDSENPDDAAYETDLNAQIKNIEAADPVEKDKYTVNFNKFNWLGASTVYREIVHGEFTGNNYTVLTTNASGIAQQKIDGEDIDGINEGICCGKFEVEEQMTDPQKARYRQPVKQTQEIKDGKAAFQFSFENVPKWTPVELVKTCIDGNITGIEFKLEGTRDFDDSKVEITATTDFEGKIDFGKLYAGTYTVTETSFNINNYKRPADWTMVDGYPTKEVIITGEETEPISLAIENIPQSELYLTKVDKDTQMFLNNSTFDLFENGAKVATFRIVRQDDGNTGIDLLWVAEDSDIYAPKPIVTPPDPDDEESTGDEDSGEDPEITPIVVDPTGDEEMGGIGEEENPVEEIAGEYNYGRLKGLVEGAEYTLKEVEAPEGYGATINYSFNFENTMKIVLENQAPEIGTTALDKNTEQHMSNAEGMVTIVDTVEYKHLTPGQEYKMSGVLMYKTDGDEYADPVKDAEGKEITAEKTFTPEEADGSIDLEFTFDASNLDGAKTVVYEELYEPKLIADDLLIAIHKDDSDEGQSIYFPEIKTTALGDDTSKHITNADEEVVITDTVQYSNIIAGKIHEMTGTLMNGETGEKVLDSQGQEITVTQKFKATAEGPVLIEEGSDVTEDETDTVTLVSGTLELKFKFDGTSLAGTKTVVFEHLYCGGKLVGEHSDLNDEDQTVYIPAIRTKASRHGNNEITDIIAYKNLLPGETYRVEGILIDKKTGDYPEGNEILAGTTFTAEEANGTVEVTFDINGLQKDLRGKTVVVFETCFIENTVVDEETGTETTTEVEIANHRDINDTNQTVEFKTPQTGQTVPWFLIGGLLTVILCAGIYLARKKIIS